MFPQQTGEKYVHTELRIPILLTLTGRLRLTFRNTVHAITLRVTLRVESCNLLQPLAPAPIVQYHIQ